MSLRPSFDARRRDLVAEIAELVRPFVQPTDLSSDSLAQLSLYVDQDLSNTEIYVSSTKLIGSIEILCNVITKQSPSPLINVQCSFA